MIHPRLEKFLSEEYASCEKDLSTQAGNYQGLQSEALLTSLDDFENIFRALPGIQTWVELGSGYGLGCILFANLHPNKQAIGIEFEQARHQKAQSLAHELGLKNVTFILGDLSSCPLPKGDTYFLYFPTGPVLDRILWEIGQREEDLRLVVIESHGDLIPRLRAEASWLKMTYKISLKAQRHAPDAVIFEKVAPKPFSWMDLSFQPSFLLIQDEDGAQWIAESRGLEWLRPEQYQLQIPPRTIQEKQIIKVMDLTAMDSRLQELILARQRGETLEGSLIRKIFIKPELRVELSSGKSLSIPGKIEQR